MPFIQEDLDLYIALALTRVDKRLKKAYGASNWVAGETAVLSIAKEIGGEIRKRYEMLPIDEAERVE